MPGATRKLAILTLFAALLLPTTSADPALLTDSVAVDPLAPAEDGSVYCTGVAPIPQPRCDAWFTAYSRITLAPGGTFTGELTCRLNGPLASWVEYRLQMVSGFLVAYTLSGTGLYAGYIHMHCEARGLFGAGGSYGGAGTISVRVDYT